jgi:phage baseplate assembly protein W
MKPYLKIPLSYSERYSSGTFEKVSVEDSIREFVDFIIKTKQGECLFDPDFGYEVWSNEFEPIQNLMQWQPKFREQIKELLEEHEPRITAIHVQEPKFYAIKRKMELIGDHKVTHKDYKITIRLDYTVRLTGERMNDVEISFEY